MIVYFVTMSCRTTEIRSRLHWSRTMETCGYKQAIAVKEREKVPTVGPAIDRRSINHTLVAYNDERIKALICFACARIRVTTGGARPHIEYLTGDWLLALPPGSLWKNFAKQEFDVRYANQERPYLRILDRI